MECFLLIIKTLGGLVLLFAIAYLIGHSIGLDKYFK